MGFIDMTEDLNVVKLPNFPLNFVGNFCRLFLAQIFAS